MDTFDRLKGKQLLQSHIWQIVYSVLYYSMLSSFIFNIQWVIKSQINYTTIIYYEVQISINYKTIILKLIVLSVALRDQAIFIAQIGTTILYRLWEKCMLFFLLNFSSMDTFDRLKGNQLLQSRRHGIGANGHGTLIFFSVAYPWGKHFFLQMRCPWDKYFSWCIILWLNFLEWIKKTIGIVTRGSQEPV
jgi:hypothetical protein